MRCAVAGHGTEQTGHGRAPWPLGGARWAPRRDSTEAGHRRERRHAPVSGHQGRKTAGAMAQATQRNQDAGRKPSKQLHAQGIQPGPAPAPPRGESPRAGRANPKVTPNQNTLNKGPQPGTPPHQRRQQVDQQPGARCTGRSPDPPIPKCKVQHSYAQTHTQTTRGRRYDPPPEPNPLPPTARGIQPTSVESPTTNPDNPARARQSRVTAAAPRPSDKPNAKATGGQSPDPHTPTNQPKQQPNQNHAKSRARPHRRPETGSTKDNDTET